MLNHGVPWQFVVTAVFIQTVFFIITLLGSLISGYLNWNPIFTLIFLILGFIIIIWTIPTLLNLSRSFYTFLFALLLLQIGTTILAFALHYKSSGLIGATGEFIPDLSDAVYFSITTFTTLGYGDLQPIESHRLTTSYEALAGMASMAIGASLVWLWCQENLIPKEMALFDGDRTNKKTFIEGRIRVRTLTGKEKELNDWILPPEPGESFYYNTKRKEWIPITKNTIVPENVSKIVIGYEKDFKWYIEILNIFKIFKIFKILGNNKKSE